MVVPRGLQGLWLYVLYSYYVQLQWAGLLYVEGQRLSHWNFLILCYFSKSLDLDFQRCTTALTKLYVNGIGHVGHVSKKAVQYRFYMSFRNLSILQNMPLALSDAVQCQIMYDPAVELCPISALKMKSRPVLRMRRHWVRESVLRTSPALMNETWGASWFFSAEVIRECDTG